MKSRHALALVAMAACAAIVVPASASPRPPHVLVFSQTAGFRHISIEHARDVLGSLARDGRFTVQFSEDPKVLTKTALARTDVVLWLHNTAGTGRQSPFTEEQEKLYGRWMLCGGGHVGVHAAADAYSQETFPEYFAVTGALISGHPVTATSALDDQDREHEGWGEPEAEIKVEDRSSPMTRPWSGAGTFSQKDEFYKLDRDPATVVKDYRLLLSLQQFNDPQGAATSQVYPGSYGERAPLAWTGSFRGKNRSFYTNLGHSVATWDQGTFQRHVVAGIQWVSNKRSAPSCVARSNAKTR